MFKNIEINTKINIKLYFRQMKLNNELNNMSWRVRPDEVLLEVGRLHGSKVGLQKLNVEVCTIITICNILYITTYDIFYDLSQIL